MPDRNSTRSGQYQSFFAEINVCPTIIGDLSTAQGLSSKIKSDIYNEEYLDLKDQLTVRMWQIIDEGLTKRQKEVLYLSMKGLTQNEIAKKLGINQTSVHKVLKGNIDYKNEKRRYGGALKKIIKLCKADPKINELLHEMQEIFECVEF